MSPTWITFSVDEADWWIAVVVRGLVDGDGQLRNGELEDRVAIDGRCRNGA